MRSRASSETCSATDRCQNVFTGDDDDGVKCGNCDNCGLERGFQRGRIEVVVDGIGIASESLVYGSGRTPLWTIHNSSGRVPQRTRRRRGKDAPYLVRACFLPTRKKEGRYPIADEGFLATLATLATVKDPHPIPHGSAFRLFAAPG